jgi:aminoglycoside phosphotransferase (APT) family kinase protein
VPEEIDWESRRAHALSPPSGDGLRRLGGDLGAAVVTVGRRLSGGVAAATHLVLVDAERPIVLKRYPAAATGSAETAALEWERLAWAERASVPTPEPLALDLEGRWFGTPALVMSFLEGSVNLFPADEQRWLESMARALAAIHDTAIDESESADLRRPHLAQRWEPWWDEPYGGAEEASVVIAELARDVASAPKVFSHDDYHPGNVLFAGNELSGVVDWSAAKMAPRASDVALCRADLAIHPGGDAPERFRAAYEAETGRRLDGLSAFDVLQADKVIHYGASWVAAFGDCGLEITGDQIRVAGLRHLHEALGHRP